MSSPLLRNMIEQYQYPLLNEDDLSGFLDSSEQDVVLFFAGNPQTFPETDDVAMILPELIKAFGPRLKAAVIAAESERTLQARYHFTTWPTLVFLRRGEYLGAISKVQDWSVYLNNIVEILDSEPSEPPAFDFNRACAASA